MSETLIGVLIGASFGFLGALMGMITNTWLDYNRAKRERLREVRLRLVGDRIQSSEVVEYIRWNRKRARLSGKLTGMADLSRAHLREIDLRGQKLVGVKLFRADLSGVDLDYADLSGCDLSKAQMERADLTGADLSTAHLNRAVLKWADLVGANLGGARLTNTDFSHANLHGAILAGADITGAIFEEANLTDAMVSRDQLATAGSLRGAILPDGRSYEEHLMEESGTPQPAAIPVTAQERTAQNGFTPEEAVERATIPVTASSTGAG